ncbi:MAG: anaerobic glycerol-3-phosphate dehydrogenase subunit B [Desulfovibrio sp.]|nr:anaerobic glycerol-3-phosphate dehydrogenase subunit B [Desulfovibrio sp.]
MNNKMADVLVVGAGMAGLMAALAAAQQGCRVKLLAAGMGALAISGGTVDLLGYVDGASVDAPWQALPRLPAKHPYRLLGENNVRTALTFLRKTLAEHGWPMTTAVAQGQECNTYVPTIMGTLRPTWLLPPGMDAQALQNARRVLVLSVEGLRDCRPSLIISQLKRYKDWNQRQYDHALLPSPFGATHRSISALDLARLADRPQTRTWLLDGLEKYAGAYDLLLIPPLCGSRADADFLQTVQRKVGCPLVEMCSIPPGVGGLRLRDALLRALKKLDFSALENATAVRAEVADDCCAALEVSAAGQKRQHKARAFILATGGILGGGLTLEPGKARESVFGMDIPVPQDVALWSEGEIFGKHLFGQLGVSVDSHMRPVDDSGKARWQNVFFAGRSLGGYDYAAEKSGLGVAAATGWQAGRMAALLTAENGGPE